MPPGVLVEGPVVDAKFRDSYISFAMMIGGSIAALVWAFWQGIGWVEISVFAGMFMHDARSASASCIATSCTAASAAVR